jgi:hypothetical protein
VPNGRDFFSEFKAAAEQYIDVIEHVAASGRD